MIIIGTAFLFRNYFRYLILLEILSYLPDIIILEEVDRYEFFNTKLREVGKIVG